MKVVSLIKAVCVLLLTMETKPFSSVTGFVDHNIKLRRALEDIKNFLPVNMVMTAIDEYLSHGEEFAYDLEACYINLRGSLNLQEKEDFIDHQKVCLNNFLNFYSVFEIIKAIVTKFFVESCPDDLEQTCNDKAEKFFKLSKEIDETVKHFSEELVNLDKDVKELKATFSELKSENVKRVVMNAILVINKENFYTQLNDVLDNKDQELAAEEVSGERPELQSSPKKSGGFIFDGGIKDDPFQNPDRYFLIDKKKKTPEDLHIIFTTDSNESDLVS